MIRPTPFTLTVVAIATAISFAACRKAVDLAPALEQEAVVTENSIPAMSQSGL